MIRRSIYLLTLALVLFFSSRLLSTSFTSDAKLTTPALRLGVIAPFSGPLSEYGYAIQNGIKLAKEDHPQRLTGLRVFYEDSKYDSASTVSAFQRLASKGVDLVYNFGSPTSEAIAPIAEARRIPLLAWSTDQTVSQNRSFVMRFINAADDFGSALNNHLQHKRYKRIALVQTENQYINSMIEGLKNALGSEQEVEVIDSYPASTNDFRSTIAKLKINEYDALGVYLLSGQVAQFYKQLEQNRIDLPTFGTDFFESRSEVHEAGAAMIGAVFPNHGVSEQFRARYINSYSNDYQLPNAGLSYDLANLLHDIQGAKNGPLTSRELLQALHQVKKREGVSGTFSFSGGETGDQHFVFPIQVREVKQSGEIAIASR